MGDFVGWSPTILGRVSFSRIGEANTRGSVICNATEDGGCLFGVSRRTSHDGPVPAWLTNIFGRFPYTDWAFFLECRPGELPFLKSACGDASSSDADMVLRQDDRAELAGTLYFANGATAKLGAAASRIRGLSRQCVDRIRRKGLGRGSTRALPSDARRHGTGI